jgi:hypothetical protein
MLPDSNGDSLVDDAEPVWAGSDGDGVINALDRQRRRPLPWREAPKRRSLDADSDDDGLRRPGS